MATEAPALDPRIEEVLRDIAADPRAKLFTCDVERLVRGLGHAKVQASVSSAGLTSAERHLLTIGREEVARLLLIGFRERLEAEQDGSFLYTHERMEASEWQKRALAARKRGFDGQAERIDLARRAAAGDSMTTAELLEACVHNAGRDSVARADLLAASHRLADRPTTRIYLAIDLSQSERWSAARGVLGAVPALGTNAIEHYHWLEWHARNFNATGKLDSASSLMEHAYRTGLATGVSGEALYLSLLSAFIIAIEGGITNRIPGLSQEIKVANPPSDFVRSLTMRIKTRKRGHVLPELLRISGRDSAVKRIIDSLDGASKEILNVWA